MLARRRRLRHRALFDRPDRLARRAIEHIEEAGLAALHHRLDPTAVDRDVGKRGRSDGVVVPQIVMHHLEVPGQLAGLRVERDEAVRIEVVPGSPAAVVRHGRRAERNVDEAQLLVGAERRPRRHVAADFS